MRSFRRVVERESAFERFEQVGCAGEQEERRFPQQKRQFVSLRARKVVVHGDDPSFFALDQRQRGEPIRRGERHAIHQLQKHEVGLCTHVHRLLLQGVSLREVPLFDQSLPQQLLPQPHAARTRRSHGVFQMPWLHETPLQQRVAQKAPIAFEHRSGEKFVVGLVPCGTFLRRRRIRGLRLVSVRCRLSFALLLCRVAPMLDDRRGGRLGLSSAQQHVGDLLPPCAKRRAHVDEVAP